MKKRNKEKIGRIIIPPEYIEVKGPVIFLAGPIRGAYNWQEEAANYINNRSLELNIASPRRPGLTPDEFRDDVFDEQVDWEHYYLARAGENGVILFWLAKEFKHDCKRVYAQTTRFELGEHVAKHHFAGIKVAVGIEDGFSNARYIRRTLSKKYPKIPICESLKETCEAAIKLAGD